MLDLTAVGQNLTPEQWYDGLLVSLAEQLRLEDALEDFWEENADLGPLQRFMTALGKVVLPRIPQRLVVFVDEIDAVRCLPFSADEFFAAIRECYNRRPAGPRVREADLLPAGRGHARRPDPGHAHDALQHRAAHRC